MLTQPSSAPSKDTQGATNPLLCNAVFKTLTFFLLDATVNSALHLSDAFEVVVTSYSHSFICCIFALQVLLLHELIHQLHVQFINN